MTTRSFLQAGWALGKLGPRTGLIPSFNALKNGRVYNSVHDDGPGGEEHLATFKPRTDAFERLRIGIMIFFL